MPKFRKKPVVIEAVQWTGANLNQIMDFMNWRNASHDAALGLRIHTLEGTHAANLGDWIIKGVNGGFSPCKDEIFAATYELEGEVITGDGSGTALPPVSQAVRQAG